MSPPTIISINSDKANNSYTTGKVIDIDLTFSENVTSTGNITVTLETGATDRTCTFTATDSSTGTCDYAVQAGDTSSDLNIKTVSGTIADQAGNAMTNFTPATNLETNKDIIIDTTASTLAEVAPIPTPAADTTPNYTFSSTETGTIACGGSCDSTDTSATSGDNTVTLNVLTNGTYADCTVIVTDTAGNASSALTITSFTISSAGITITEPVSSTDIEEGGTTDTYMIVLDTTPTANVVITIIPDTNSTTDLATLTFTSANWNTLQIITVAAADDTDIEGDHTSANTDSNYDGISISSVTASIKDNDFAGGGLPVGSLGSPTQPEPTEENSAGGFKATVINQDENTITLKLYVGANTTKMAISNIPDFKNASIVPYQEEIEWKLLNVKYPIPNTIYIKFYTKYGVASEVISASINSNPNYIKDGDLIQNPNAEGLEQFDVYITKIINNKKYKRLILTPRIFESYSHFDKNKDNNPWNDITTTDKQTIDAFITSNLVRCQDEQRNINDPKVYELEPMSDTGTKHHFNLTAEQFTTKGYRWNEVFIINREERDWYEAGEEIRE